MDEACKPSPFGFPANFPPPTFDNFLRERSANAHRGSIDSAMSGIDTLSPLNRQENIPFGGTAYSPQGILSGSQRNPGCISSACLFSSSPGGSLQPMSGFTSSTSPSQQAVLQQGMDSISLYRAFANCLPLTHHTQTGSFFSQSNTNRMDTVMTGCGDRPSSFGLYGNVPCSSYGNQTLASKIASSLSKYRSVPIKRKSAIDLSSPRKVYLSEKKMAARMGNLSISNSKNEKRSMSIKDIEARLSSDDEDEDVISDGQPRIQLAKDLKSKLNKQIEDDILPKSILESITSFSHRPCMELVLWRPPSGMATEVIESLDHGLACDDKITTEDKRCSAAAPTDVSLMDASDTDPQEAQTSPLNLTMPGSSTPTERRSLPGSFPPLMENSVTHPTVANNANILGMSGASSAFGPPLRSAPVPIAVVNPFPQRNNVWSEDNNNSMSQQDLFDTIDDDMDL